MTFRWRSRIITYVGAALVLIIVLFAVASLLFLKSDIYRNELEQSLSQALGIEVTVGAPVRISWLPGFHVTLEAVRGREANVDIVSARKATLGIRLVPLLRGVVSIDTIALDDASIVMERNRNGRLNFLSDGQAEPGGAALNLSRLSVANAALQFTGQHPWRAFQATACDIEVRDPHRSKAEPTDFAEDMAFTGEISCGEIKTQALTLSDVKVSANADAGVIVFEPISLHMLDADGTGRVVADLSGAVPQWKAQFSLVQFPIGAFLRTLSAELIATGSMDFTTNLTMQGASIDEMTQTLAGTVSLRGSDLTLEGIDLDEELSQLQSSRNFNLVGVGAFFIAGPVGLAVTRGYEFASLMHASAGSSEIRTLVSDWQVEGGIMRAQDVAMATVQHRIAVRGSLDFVNQDFDDVVVAMVNADGCIEVQQAVKGTFAKPVVDAPSVVEALTRPALELLKRGQDLLSSAPCDAFYSGSVVTPR